MNISILLVLFALVCSSKSKENLENFLQKKCKEYEEKYKKVDKTDIQDEDSYYALSEPGTSSAVNGVTVLPGVFPHMAALGYTTENGIDWVCGGTLISEQYILTAAHCLKRRHNSNIEEVEWVRLGVTKLSGKYGPYPKDYKIIKRIAHPSYEPPSKYNDIGLLQLEASTEIMKYIKPVCFTTKSEKDFPEFALSYTAIGWGLTTPNGNRTDALQLVNLDLYSEEECNEAYNTISPRILKNGINQEQQICLGSNKFQPSDTCQGDSGGPLHITEIETLNQYQFGIIAFGKSCGLKKSAGVYTRVSYYLPWIKSIVWPNEK